MNVSASAAVSARMPSERAARRWGGAGPEVLRARSSQRLLAGAALLDVGLDAARVPHRRFPRAGSDRVAPVPGSLAYQVPFPRGVDRQLSRSNRLTSSRSIRCTLLRATNTVATFIRSRCATSAPDRPSTASRWKASHVRGSTRSRTRGPLP